jgi:hypothetical protein
MLRSQSHLQSARGQEGGLPSLFVHFGIFKHNLMEQVIVCFAYAAGQID